MVLQLFFNSLQNIGIYSLATMGLVLIFRTSATTNFSQGMIGTFAAFFASNLVLYQYPDLPFPVAIGIGASIAFIMGCLIDSGIIRQGRRVSPVGKQIITMGLLLIFYAAIPPMFPSITTRTPSVPRFSFNNRDFTLFGYDLFITEHALVCLFTAIILLSILFTMLKFTKWGIAIRATASNETVAQMLGINTRLVTGITWGIAGALVAVAGSSTAMSLNASMLAQVQIFGFLACVLGGLSSFWAPVAGSVLIPLFLNYSALFSPRWTVLITFIIIMLIILIRPNGLFGKQFVKKV